MRDPHGFTLMEMTVVVSAICVLTAILFPVLSNVRRKTGTARCLASLEQVGLSLGMYAREHAGHFPPTDDDLTPLLGRCLLTEPVLHCPAAGEREHREGQTSAEPAGRSMGGSTASLESNDNFDWPTADPVPPVDYYYRAGFCDDDPPDTLIACDSNLRRHAGRSNALFADGHAKLRYDPRGDGTKPPSPADPLTVILRERHLRERVPLPYPAPGGEAP